MPVRTSYVQGTPNWVDLQTSDHDAAKSFYAGLFGWTYDDQPMSQGAVYSMAKLGEEPVAAIAPQAPEVAAAGAAPMWNTYLAVDSVDDAVAKVEAAGGRVAMAPFDVTDAGRMAFVLDPGGAGVALWQAGTHIGATLVNEAGTVIWNELITTDASATTLYEQVVGVTTARMDTGTGTYTLPASRSPAPPRRSCPACPTTGTCTSLSRTQTRPWPKQACWAGRSRPSRSTHRSAGSRLSATRRAPCSASSSGPASPPDTRRTAVQAAAH